MICFNCRKQIPDDSEVCPNCGSPIIPHEQVTQEIKVRRYQRWVFYLILAVVFGGMTAFAAKVYNENLQAQNKMSEVSKAIADKEQELSQKQTQITQLQQSLSDSQKSLEQKTDEYRKFLDEKTSQLSKLEQLKAELGSSNAAVYSFLITSAIGTSARELAKIPLADYNLAGAPDTDNDGLSDLVEDILGTDKTKADTDGDTFKDKEELLNGYDPLIAGKTGRLPLDSAFVQKNKGNFLMQVEQKNEVWYVSPKDGKRYFLGRPGEVLQALQKLNTTSTSTPQ